MKRIQADNASNHTDERFDYANGTPGFRSVVTPATRAHEAAVAAEYTWPALPPHLRTMPSARAMVRHWVRTGYHWAPSSPAAAAG